MIIKGLDISIQNPRVFKKYKWLKEEYNQLIILSKNLKLPIRQLNEDISGQNIHFGYTDDFYNLKEK